MAGGNKWTGPLAMTFNALGMGLDNPANFNLTNPRSFKDQLTMSDSDINSILQELTTRAGSQVNKATADAKQVAAAKGTLKNSGAVFSDIVQGATRGVASAVPGLKREQRRSFADYLNLQMGFDEAKMNYQNEINNRRMGGLGNLASTALLWSGGYLG